MSDNQYINGLIVKAPNERAPDYVKAKLSIKRVDLIAWLQGQTGDWINADVKVSQGGKWYCAVDTWKPNGDGGQRTERPRSPSRAPVPGCPQPEREASNGFPDGDDIPFRQFRHRTYY